MYGADERVARMTRSIPHPMPPGAIENLIAKSHAEDREEDLWVLDGSASGHAELLGLIGLERMDRSQSEVGYWVAPAFWNTGLASEAVRAILNANSASRQNHVCQRVSGQPCLCPCFDKRRFSIFGRR